MRDRQTCIDCGKQSPETDTNYTLISAQFGWRLTRKRLPDGSFVVEWRCPDCWRAFKQTRAGAEQQGAWPASGSGHGGHDHPPPSRLSSTSHVAVRPSTVPPPTGGSMRTPPPRPKSIPAAKPAANSGSPATARREPFKPSR